MANRSMIIMAAAWASLVSFGLCDTVTFVHDNKTVAVEGNILLVDRAGNLLLEGRDGQHYTVMAPQIIQRVQSKAPVKPFPVEQLRISLLEEYGPRFKSISTSNYMIVYSCGADYAKEASRLMEKTHSVFKTHFARNGFKLETPVLPLIAVIMASREEYRDHITSILGARAAESAGVYVVSSNRMFMYDSFGGETGEAVRSNVIRAGEGISRSLQEQNITAIINQSVHQLAYNLGFHNRQVIENPLWLVEGMAMYFESPDIDAKGGWSGAGNVNKKRLTGYKETLQNPIPLNDLVLNDDLFQGPRLLDAYSMSWAFTYYLTKSRNPQYNDFLLTIKSRPLMTPYTPKQRLTDFRKSFGKSPDQLETEFRRFMSRL